ncbi:RNA polymerase sigma factor [Paludicola sp. MB14-C6]|uniref:RNA polymerase sigma factor n=1 Tax=Paludihabitans sp. MB14-C6 TaxID=3070656 RepID=UPI0027DBDFC1|nr:RNA polymerase sigma factor [Paludicola sp. MB14-C6]WMJ21956.1 RNA polymerase sigma factor [Paludicola sp. MB14-C6]
MKEFDEIYTTYVSEIQRYFYYLYLNEDIASELTQETFYRVFCSLVRFSGKCSMKTWIYSIAKHVHYKQLDKQKTVSLEENISVDSFTMKADDKITIEQAILSLPEPYKQVVILHLINDLPLRRVGEIMEHTENWAKVTYYRDKLLLQSKLSESEE